MVNGSSLPLGDFRTLDCTGSVKCLSLILFASSSSMIWRTAKHEAAGAFHPTLSRRAAIVTCRERCEGEKLASSSVYSRSRNGMDYLSTPPRQAIPVTMQTARKTHASIRPSRRLRLSNSSHERRRLFSAAARILLRPIMYAKLSVGVESYGCIVTAIEPPHAEIYP